VRPRVAPRGSCCARNGTSGAPPERPATGWVRRL
jgi:hypothetical protein